MTPSTAEASRPGGVSRGGSLGPWAGLALVLVVAGVAALFGGPDPRSATADPGAHFDPAFRRLSAMYAGTKYSFWAAGTILQWGTLVGIVALKGGPVLARLGGRLGRGRRAPSAFFSAALLLVALAIATLPLSWASGFVTEHRFGLATQSAAEWLIDTARREGFWTAVYALAATGFLGCLRRWPGRGWLAAAGGGALVATAGTMLAPILIDPLFHDFRRLTDLELEDEIVAMGERAGLDIDRVRVVDASRRTRRLNAYVTGLGATRQVVLYDNLLERAPRNEILLVVAHELGHAAERHVAQGLLWAVAGIAAGAWLLAGFARLQARRPGLAGPADPAGLPLLFLAVSVLLFLASPIEGSISRRMEAQADWMALELTRDPDTFIAVERRLAGANLVPVTPPHWIVTWFYTHPPVLERIGMGEHWRKQPARDVRTPRPELSDAP